MPECSHCPPELIARELALKFGLDEYLVIFEGHHWRKGMIGNLIAKAPDAIGYWHAFIRATVREQKLIKSRY